MHHLTISVSSDQVRQVLARLGRCRSSVCKPCDRQRLSFLLTRPHSKEWARFLPSEYSAQLWVTETLRSIYMYRTCYVTLRTSGTKKWLRLLRIDFQAWAWLTKRLIDLVKEMNQILPSLKCLKALFWNCTRCIIATQELNVRAQVFVPLRVSHRVYSDSYTYLLTRIIRILLHSSISKFAQRIERQSEVDAVNERDQHGSSHLGRLISNTGPNRCSPTFTADCLYIRFDICKVFVLLLQGSTAQPHRSQHRFVLCTSCALPSNIWLLLMREVPLHNSLCKLGVWALWSALVLHIVLIP